jgi:hypothetical protein
VDGLLIGYLLAITRTSISPAAMLAGYGTDRLDEPVATVPAVPNAIAIFI